MAKVEVTMPKMGESITEGTVVTWHKKPGDRVELDESLLEIGTDKVDTDVPSPHAGTVVEILVEEGQTVDVGTAVAVIETNGEAEDSGSAEREPAEAGASPDDESAEVSESADDGSVEGSESADDEAAEASKSADDESAEASESAHDESADPRSAERTPKEAGDPNRRSSSRSGETIDVFMPKMGESVMEGTIIAWLKSPGEAVELDEPLLEIGTDKVDTEVPSPAAGVLEEILVEEGETVDVETKIAVISTPGTGDEATDGESAGPSEDAGETSTKRTSGKGEAAPDSAEGDRGAAGAPGEGVATARSDDSAAGRPDTARHADDGTFLSPLVRSIAREEGISPGELSSIRGSGRDGRVTKEDVLSFIERRKQAPAEKSPETRKAKVLSPGYPVPKKSPGERVEIVQMDRMRRIIAEHMTRSKATSAHVTSFAEADVSNLVRLREQNKQAFLEREGVKLTYTPFFVYAAVEALREHPILNASVVEDAIHYRKDYHIGIAVAIGKTGLVVPVIHDAGQKNLVGLAHAAADLAERSRTKQLLPDELQGGTFTVTNVGSLGSIMGTPIISQPQVGILATGAIKKRPVVIEDPEMGDTIGIRQMMYISLSYDHRVVDGAIGASFLARFVGVLESFDRNEAILS